ncbi:MAG: hypothetical protein MUF27_02570 [Acidobacteria bacterium]|jgi:hypothetical protein|nr:hypothetical protein [Acidobacteriota bacterium]
MGQDERERRQTLVAWLIAGLALGAAALALGPKAPWRFVLAPFERAETSGAAPVEPGLVLAAPAPRDPDPAELLAVDARLAEIQAARGGRVDGPAGAARLALPPGALPEDARVEIARLAEPDPLGGGATVDLRPDGLELRTPGRLELPLPAGLAPEQVEIAVFDASRARWEAEPVQAFDPRRGRLTASIAHFSLRRVRIRPGLNFPYDPRRSGATFLLADDLDQQFERLAEGRWVAVGRRTPEYRALVEAGRSRRHALIAAGRLRAVAGPPQARAIVDDDRVTASLPAGAPEARTGWVRVTALDERGRPTPRTIVAQVVGETPPALIRSGLAVRLSRAAMERLGLVFGRDFGLDREAPDQGWIRYTATADGVAMFQVPVQLEPAESPPPRSD